MRATFARIEQQFGVPAPVIVAFWALESDFGANMGKYHSLSAIASLAYDCRRSDSFRAQLFDALRLIERGDLRPEDMIGSWAGELGQTQMMPSEYYQYAVDYDGDGKRNLIRSVPDVLASTANYLVGLGWKRGEPWLTEVRVPANLPWDQADLVDPAAALEMGGVRRHARRRQAASGRQSAGFAVAADGTVRPGLPRLSRISRSICSGTTRWSIRPRPPISPPASPARRRCIAAAPPPALAFQRHQGIAGACWRAPATMSATIDGFSGLKTRQAVKAMQMKYGLPADSYPTAELLARMRGGG